ncbi:MerR family transcriptional regulator [Paenibacillus beijingensis]|uniref:MerR family transcriptional regulator n=1 Tax=Paenibacillus beijingensis TaxID=1126833 RepID=A0A0D5NI08_9BACL|nr:MerR family transcriptional regulator [Paenibacillus beijingensis]AJY74735.1 MerR family transcriptional regulator [Paenibacillus beijingensis]
MLKISAFSKLSRVSVKTLRYYDELGLLKPALVDKHNGYRYYTAQQLLTVKRIVAFKEQGFTLEQIMPLLQEDVPPALVKTSLIAKQAELLQTIEEAQRQLHEIGQRLSHVHGADDHDAEFTVSVKKVEPQLSASIRDVVPRANLCLMLDELARHVRSHGENDSRSLTVLWHDCSGEEDLVDLEVAIPVSKEIPGSGRTRIGLLPELKMAASLVHRCDPYGSSCPAAAELAAWIGSNGYVPSDEQPIREIYLTSDKDLYGNMRLAEVLVPVEHAARHV